ncbi:MAG: sulfatase-like hydrolase/transferase [Leptospirales bacterium]|nr:sulfatase-like hydrolase/transferase [Leptospirales bacterium]
MDFIDRALQFIPKPGIFAYLIIAFQLIYTIIFIVNNVSGYSLDVAGIFNIIFSFLTLTIFVSSLEKFFYNRFIRRVLSILFLVIIWSLNTYQSASGVPLDFSLVDSNIGISFSREAFSVIASYFSLLNLLLLIVFIAIVILFEYGYYLYRDKENVNFRTGIVGIIIWMVLIIIPVQSGDGFTLFTKSMFFDNKKVYQVGDLSLDYPYERDSIPLTSFHSSVPDKDRPNVFLILIESFNANFVESRAPDGIDYTPNFNSFINKGLYIERFYGNSMQTCKGQAATYFSILPSIKGKLFVDYPNLNIKGFPGLLRDSGYKTIFFQAYHDLKFDNTDYYMKKAGFSVVMSYGGLRRDEDKPYIWGWGVEDKIFYERFFEMLDSIHAETPQAPIFASLITVATHIPCTMPAEKRIIFNDPKDIKENYSNAIRLSDSQLPGFFKLLKEREYLKNSIVIITADHSFPMNEHGVYNNEVCFYDETFRIPFLIIWDGVIKPERVAGMVFSQIDIGPTIMDMLGISEGNHNMIGTSIFDRNDKRKVYLIQPYNGMFLEVVDYPLKYIFHAKTGKEYIFDLKKDPMEKINLISKSSDETITRLRDSLAAIYLNQRLIDENRIINANK